MDDIFFYTEYMLAYMSKRVKKKWMLNWAVLKSWMNLEILKENFPLKLTFLNISHTLSVLILLSNLLGNGLWWSLDNALTSALTCIILVRLMLARIKLSCIS